MKAIDLARLEAAVQASDIEEGARGVLLDWLARDRQKHLEIGRRHLNLCTFIENRLEEGRTLNYCLDVAAQLYGMEVRSARRIWTDFRENLHIVTVAAAS